ncbi:TonB-dependent receptor [Ferrovibrio sp.]|uniref:TonB-dependent receptor family protein n=1 Tax=Ferrovibrio sp. TaxID=1917215 RepID=UPI0025C554CD|nr:TonB-dependent receptor [Ferrovibrio sp.]MBX3456391.1 TonB-dependent receptor [Ferrovibrio sp.]
MRNMRLVSALLASTTLITGLSLSARAQDGATTLSAVTVTASRLGGGITGASTTVIDSEEIARTPGDTLQDVLSRQPGIQTRSLFGGVAGTGTTIDMRGFGASAGANTLILLNGRRLNDIDLSGVDLAAIPKSSIQRIEVIRGNAAAVLYGDGAVGGAINIITATPSGQPQYSVDLGIGTLGQREANVASRLNAGGFDFSGYAGFINSDGYRDNNKLLERNASLEIRRLMDFGELYVTAGVDEQQLGAPGARRVTLTSDLMASDRKGATTPFDFSNRSGQNMALGGTYEINDALELTIDAGARRKEQHANFRDSGGFHSYVDTELTTLSFTPRLNWQARPFDLPLNSILGFDYYQSSYSSYRQREAGDTPIHRYTAAQDSAALYGQSTLNVTKDTALSGGLRYQRSETTARDAFNTNAPGGGFGSQVRPLDDVDPNWAAHLGAEHHFMPELGVFARMGRSFRLATLDERIGGPTANFRLKTQTSMDYEAGFEGRIGPADYRISAYYMELENEIHYSPATFNNINLDPTRRRGIESSGSYRVMDGVKLRGALAYTESEFREGRYAGNRVPLVSNWTGSLGLSWDILPKYLLLDIDTRFVGNRRMDNDQSNFQPTIPAYALVDLRLSGKLDVFDNSARWSFLVQNLLDRDYYNYSVASSSTFGTYNAYPLPGRTAMARIGMDF